MTKHSSFLEGILTTSTEHSVLSAMYSERINTYVEGARLCKG